jgi:hypothetical protein
VQKPSKVEHSNEKGLMKKIRFCPASAAFLGRSLMNVMRCKKSGGVE